MNLAMLKQLNKVIVPMKHNECHHVVHPMFKMTSEHNDIEASKLEEKKLKINLIKAQS